jgi:hypothetical protein
VKRLKIRARDDANQATSRVDHGQQFDSPFTEQIKCATNSLIISDARNGNLHHFRAGHFHQPPEEHLLFELLAKQRYTV